MARPSDALTRHIFIRFSKPEWRALAFKAVGETDPRPGPDEIESKARSGYCRAVLDGKEPAEPPTKEWVAYLSGLALAQAYAAPLVERGRQISWIVASANKAALSGTGAFPVELADHFDALKILASEITMDLPRIVPPPIRENRDPRYDQKIRCSAEQAETWKRKAADAGYNFSNYSRILLFGPEVELEGVQRETRIQILTDPVAAICARLNQAKTLLSDHGTPQQKVEFGSDLQSVHAQFVDLNKHI